MLREVGDAAREEDFNRFDVALCDVPVDRFLLDVVPGFLFDFLGDSLAVRLVLAIPVLEPFDDFALCDCPEGVLGDFLRDFLDIRLPFVAFGGSIITVLRTLGVPDSSRWLGKSDGLGVWLQGFRRTACPLVE